MPKRQKPPTADQIAQQPIAYGYVRVSSAGQAQSGLSLAEQKRQVFRYWQAVLEPRGYRWAGGEENEAGCYVDTIVSGSVPLRQREHGSLLWTRVRPGDAVISAKLDRTFRSTTDAVRTIERWWEQSIEFHAISEGLVLSRNNPMAKAMLQIMSIFAEMERNRMKERQKDWMAVAKRLGRPTSWAKWGFKNVGARGQRRCVFDEDKREAARMAIWLHTKRKPRPLTYRQIALQFRAEGRCGMKWDAVKVWQFIGREIKLAHKEKLCRMHGVDPTPANLLSTDPELLRQIYGTSDRARLFESKSAGKLARRLVQNDEAMIAAERGKGY